MIKIQENIRISFFIFIAGIIALHLFSHISFAEELDALSKAVKNTLRLSPSAFPQLPQEVADELNKQKCKIPQEVVPGSKPGRPHNVVSGQFKKAGQTDWAVLCSVKEHSRIMIFLNGSAKDVEFFGGWSADRNSMQGWGEDADGNKQYMFSRLISSDDRDYILEHYERYGGPTPPPIDHDGLGTGISGKYSVTNYWYEGKWLALQGAD